MAYITEEEQLETIKRFWQRFGKFIIAAFIAVLLFIYGSRFWEQRQQNYKQQASNIYSEILSIASSEDDREMVNLLLAELKDKYKKTPYAVLASLLEAKLALEKQDLNSAKKALIWSLENNLDDDLKNIIHIRLARVLNANDEPENALLEIKKVKADAFAALAAEVQGDINSKMSNYAKAIENYEMAKAGYEDSSALYYVEMKKNNVTAKLKAETF